MFDIIPISIGWICGQQIVQICLIRYLTLLEVPALYASLFFLRLASIAVFLANIIYKILVLEHPTENKPNLLGQPFRFSLAILFTACICECICISLSLHALYYYSVVHFIALFQIFRAFFRSWINNVTPLAILSSFLLMALVYLLEDWLKVTAGDRFVNKWLAVNKDFEWKPLIMVIAASGAKTLGIWLFKIMQMKKHLQQKAFIDRISWASQIADEPDKITHGLCVVNNLFARYLEAQLLIHCESNSIKVENLSQEEMRQLIDSYFDNKLSYSFTEMQNYKIFQFINQEAQDDPNLYKMEDTLFRRLIKERVFQIQLYHQQFQDLFGTDRYISLKFEIIYQDYGVHEFIWDIETPYIQLFFAFFEGTFCFVASYFNGEHNDDFFNDGFKLYAYIRDYNYYLWITLLLGILYIFKIFSYKLMFLWDLQTYFFVGIFIELIIVYLSMIWIEAVGYLQVLGLIIAYCIMSVLYRSAEKVRDQKSKLFYLSFVAFLVRVQKFAQSEGSEIMQIMSLCAERLNLEEFLKILAQVLCSHGLISKQQLGHIKFNYHGQSPFFKYFIPFIFQSQQKYENVIYDHDIFAEEEDQEQQTKFDRYIIQSKYEENKSQIKSDLYQTRKIEQQSRIQMTVFNKNNIVESRIVQNNNNNNNNQDQIQENEE